MKVTITSSATMSAYLNSNDSFPVVRKHNGTVYELDTRAVENGNNWFTVPSGKLPVWGRMYSGSRWLLKYTTLTAGSISEVSFPLSGSSQQSLIYEDMELDEGDLFYFHETSNRQGVLYYCFFDDMVLQVVNAVDDTKTAHSKNLTNNVTVNVSAALQNYISAKKALGAGIADKYIAQPIVLGGIQTPLYSIVSNTASADPDLFTEVAIGGQKFFVVDYGIGVKVQ
jgi:hypothetical protein